MESEKTPEKVHAAWKEGSCHPTEQEVCLVSSDDVRFYVPDFLLRAHSRVLRDMFTVPQAPSANSGSAGPVPPKIELTDKLCESSTALSLFLSLTKGDEEPHAILEFKEFEGKMVETLHGAILLAQKWDSPMILKDLALVLRYYSRCNYDAPEIKPLDVIILASKFSDLTTFSFETFCQVLWDYKPPSHYECWEDAKGASCPVTNHWGLVNFPKVNQKHFSSI
ncbi:hypothetical protein L198_04836 [Cryptococcus wingfieldii CBS 7118]|uniref:BTB domain-containing protein n=1 Tax=Cryptococcus wingfieldii CBS 7118 TaxID=1295528 RepID=A0A1E3J208_9TREE|nr:hypothetical protein L198_04836 [Cryptococcus wingfieldii CBS 7118]ODN94695.1 hypothetical protein L198_04836 [Cryptococcus wingfieldii CBS 7118]